MKNVCLCSKYPNWIFQNTFDVFVFFSCGFECDSLVTAVDEISLNKLEPSVHYICNIFFVNI